jgi:hypothetical protein
MKKYLSILLLFFTLSSFGQSWTKISGRYDNQWASFDSALFIPTGCGTPSGVASLRNAGKTKMAAMYWDSCNLRLYVFHPVDSTWKQPGAGITLLNGLTGSTQTFATGNSGTNFNISSSGTTHTFNLPDAGGSKRGALTSADWIRFDGKQDAITLTTTGSSGSATFTSSTLNIPTYTLSGLGGITRASLSATAPVSYNSSTGVFSMAAATGSVNGYLTSTDWTTFNNKQSTITLTTTGSSGAATFTSSTLNIPNYTLSGLGGIGLSSLSASSPLSYNSGTGAFSIQVSTSAQNGYLSSTDWNTFNRKLDSISLTATSPLTYTSSTKTLSTSVTASRLLGRYTNSTGAAQEIKLGTGLTLSNDTLSASSSGGSPGGSTTQVQYNSSGAFAGSSSLTWDNSNTRLSVGGTASPTGTLTVKMPGALSSSIGMTMRNSADNADLYSFRGNGDEYYAGTLFSLHSQGLGNTTWGYNAGQAINTNSTLGTYVGRNAGYSTTSGDENVMIGWGAGYQNTTAGNNTYIGAFAAQANASIATKAQNVFIGAEAGYNSAADNSCFIGYRAGNYSLGSSNMYIGRSAGAGVVTTNTGSNNSAIGYNALSSVTTGSNNIAIGTSSGINITTGAQTTLIGAECVSNASGGTTSNAVYVGYRAGYSSTGDDNAMIGRSAGQNNTTGYENVFIGRNACSTNTTGRDITIVGAFGDVSAATGIANATGIGANVVVSQSNSVILGSSCNVGIGTSTPNASSKLDVNSTTQGSNPFPRMTSTQRLAISSPAVGLHVYQTDVVEGVYVYKSGGWAFAY